MANLKIGIEDDTNSDGQAVSGSAELTSDTAQADATVSVAKDGQVTETAGAKVSLDKLGVPLQVSAAVTNEPGKGTTETASISTNLGSGAMASVEATKGADGTKVTAGISFKI